MKILFIGVVDFSAHALRKLINMQANVVGVYSINYSSVNYSLHIRCLMPRHHKKFILPRVISVQGRLSEK
jgi:methionyl-tRNA formyltransferase